MSFAAYKLEIFLPEDHFPALQKALQDVDAGHIGNYDSCLSYSRVVGTWRPLEGAHPYVGEEREISREAELKVEVTVRAEKLDVTLAAIKEVHPYEEPVVNVIGLSATGLSHLPTGTEMIPEEDPLEPAEALSREDVVFFWMTEEENEEFSNWYPAEFTLEGITYWCTEQYFMAKKALLCGDTRAYNAIMSEKHDPYNLKLLGRNASGFAAVKETWDSGAAMEVMFNANMAKFRQNPSLKQKLLATENKLLVEASPKDVLWGIGLSREDPLALCPEKWPGKNQQGRVLMLVRKALG